MLFAEAIQYLVSKVPIIRNREQSREIKLTMKPLKVFDDIIMSLKFI
jgi:hypothetical protein